CRQRWSRSYRSARDLAWVMERSPEDFTRCDVCKKNHTKELCPPHQYMHNKVKKECQKRTCLYCMFKDDFNPNHRYRCI
ncbi:hypothetical protein PFISCL1PPCAC_9452, partial [Pristionchus fissidentatus]